MFCSQCGSKMDDNAKFCPVCGKQVIRPGKNSDRNGQIAVQTVICITRIQEAKIIMQY